MQLISNFNKGIRFSLCATYIFGKDAWGIPLKDKKGITIVSAIQKVLNKSDRQPNKIWSDKSSEFYNRSMKSWLEKMGLKCIQLTMKENQSLLKDLLELKNKIYKHVTLISKNVYIDKLDDIVNECNNTYHRTNKMKPIDVKNNTYIDFGKENNDKDSKFKLVIM